MSKEAMKQALEALEIEEAQTAYPGRWLTNAITALQKALANEALDRMAENARELGLDYEPVWGSGPTNKDYEDSMRQKRLHQLTSPPPQRTWVGLTDEEKVQLWNHDTDAPLSYADAIEAKLKEKNT